MRSMSSSRGSALIGNTQAPIRRQAGAHSPTPRTAAPGAARPTTRASRPAASPRMALRATTIRPGAVSRSAGIESTSPARRSARKDAKRHARTRSRPEDTRNSRTENSRPGHPCRGQILGARGGNGEPPTRGRGIGIRVVDNCAPPMVRDVDRWRGLRGDGCIDVPVSRCGAEKGDAGDLPGRLGCAPFDPDHRVLIGEGQHQPQPPTGFRVILGRPQLREFVGRFVPDIDDQPIRAKLPGEGHRPVADVPEHVGHQLRHDEQDHVGDIRIQSRDEANRGYVPTGLSGRVDRERQGE